MTNDYGNLELHKVLLAAMKDFDAVCRKYKLCYILHGGTCLGAVRHNGFIPWDDDVDIAMLREDYEALIKIAPKEFGNRYRVYTYQTDPTIPAHVMKIYINNSDFRDNDGNEAFLDIFAMSDVPNSRIGQIIQNKIAIFLNYIQNTKIGEIKTQTLKSKLVLGTLSRLPYGLLHFLIEWNIKHFPHGKSRFVDIVATANYNNNTGYAWDLIPKSYMMQRVETEFEGEKFYITAFWDEYLKSHYGDYMMPPPIEKRTNKHGIAQRTVEG